MIIIDIIDRYIVYFCYAFPSAINTRIFEKNIIFIFYFIFQGVIIIMIVNNLEIFQSSLNRIEILLFFQADKCTQNYSISIMVLSDSPLHCVALEYLLKLCYNDFNFFSCYDQTIKNIEKNL